MKIFLISLICFIAITGSPIATAQTPATTTQESESQDETQKASQDEKKVENIYLDLLKKRKTDRESHLAEQAKRKNTSEKVQNVTREFIKQIQYQIDLVEAKIAKGETFGSKEYDEVDEVLKKQSADASKRLQKDIDETYKMAREKSQLEYEKKIAEANRKYAEARDKATKKFDATMGAAALLTKFRANKNKLGIVIWNLPVDEKLHERFTRTVNIRLLKGEQVVWSRKNYKLNRKQASNPIKIPNVIFNKVVVDVVKWQGVGGGLAEIEVYAGKENIAANRPCEVTNSETLPIHLDDRHSFTDGNTEPTVEGEGYWIPEEKKKASVMIDLLGTIEEDE